MSQPSGWYDDPREPDQLRYWDGVLWTAHTTPKRTSTPGPLAWGGGDGPAYDTPSTTPSAQPPWGGYPGQEPASSAPTQGYDRPPARFDYGAAPQYAWHAGRPTSPDGVPLADWWQRLLARIIDGMIVGAVVIVVGWPWISGVVTVMTDLMAEAIRDAEAGLATSVDQAALQDQLTRYLVPLTLISVAVSVVYDTYFLVRSGATPGKRVLGITVRRRLRPGPLTVLEALKRQVIQQGCNLLSLVPVGSLIGLVLQPLDVLWLLWDRQRQALHDKMADTLVVRTPKLR
ncbi:MAG: RDD family protein [Dermatophilaceae bacterium]